MIHCALEWQHEPSTLKDTTSIPPHWLDSWQYAMTHRTATTKLFSTTASTLRYALSLCSVDGLCMEFGTRFGTSARILQETNTYPLFAFDSFEGLPTAGTPFPKGVLNRWICARFRRFHPSVVGWYSESSSFMKHNQGPSDYYTSTATSTPVPRMSLIKCIPTGQRHRHYL